MSLIVRLRPWLGRLQAVLAGAIVLAVAVVLARRWDEVQAQDWQFRPGPLALSVVIVVAAILVWALGWAVIVRRLGAVNQPVREIARVYIYSNLARYLPGAVWNLFARAISVTARGLGQRPIWTATVIDLTVAIATGLLLYVASLALGSPALVPAPLAAAGAAVLLVAISPPALALVDRRLAARFGGGVVVRWGEYSAYLAFSCLIWAGIGVAFYLFIAGLYPIEPSLLPAVIGIWSLSVVGGLLAIGVPQGLGVKEGLLVLGLSTLMPTPAATAIAVSSRLWMICCDILAVGIWWTVDAVETKRRAAALSGWPADKGGA